MSNPVPPSNPLVQFRVEQLKGICQELGLPVSGTKTELIARILSHDPDYLEKVKIHVDEKAVEAGEPPKPASLDPNQMLCMMFQMFQDDRARQEADRAEDRRRQENREERLMRMMSEHRGNNSRSPVVSRNGSLNSINQDSNEIRERFKWLFSDLEWKMKRLEEDLEQGTTSAACKQSLLTLEKGEDKLNTLIGEKLFLLEDQESQEEITIRYQQSREQVRQLRRKTLSYCHHRDEEEKAGGLPSGVSIPEFQGDPNIFPMWLESFEALVHSNVKVSTFCKYRYLRQAMVKDAAACLNGF